MPQNKSKIIFFGTSDFAVPALRYLIQNGYYVTAVITQPEKPAGRLRVFMPSPVKKLAVENKIHVFEPHSLRDEDFLKTFKHLNPDISIVAAFGKIIPAAYLEIPRTGFLNIHPSLLPKYRGPSPIQTAIMNGDKESGVTIMKMDEQIDHGAILGITNYELGIANSYKETEKDLAELGGKLLLEILPKCLSGEIEGQEQNHAEATFTKMLHREDGKIDWSKSAEDIYNRIRALNPEPGTWTTWKNKTVNIRSGEVLDRSAEEAPGTVFRVDNKIAVTTSKCYLILKQIQLEGGKEMDAVSFVNGHPDFLGSHLG